jgi:plasmid maintenance system antidote protein VapI
LPNFIRLRKKVGTREDYWLKLLSQGPLEVPETEDPIFASARNRLCVSRIKPKLLKAMEAKMFDDKHVREAIEAEAFLKGEAKGMAKGMAKGRAKVMKLLRAKRVSPDLIAAVSAALTIK